ncbi:MFS transporter [Rhizobium tubonense]|uniref:MFS transporter n=1 Tax=Rhizobium tubonense TaxID=484088 RepID=A0A2W4EW76_9HYPH|nr:MFS transporter [Rhizobium tubonense]PZM17256.1 MFS transporter [Rhizobium tubonense]
MTSSANPQPKSQVDDASAKWVLAVSVLGSSLGFIDSSVVNVALPAIQDDLSAGLASIQWVANGYMLTLASFILLGGALGDRLGTLRAFRIGLTIFVAASVGCALSFSVQSLVAARLIQGAGAALLVPTSLALISQAYTGEARGKAIGTWSAAGGVLMALGPPLGGWMVDHASWRSIFFINVPIAALALLLSFKIVRGQARDASRRLDIPGSVLAVLALGCMTYGLIELGQGAMLAGSALLATSVPLMASFIYVEARSSAPIMPLRLFRDRNFAGSNALTAILYGGLGGAIFMLPFVLIKVHHYSPTEAGAAFLPLSIILGLGSRLAGGVAGKVGRRLPLIVGPTITTVGFAMLALSAQMPSYWTSYLPGLVLIGIGMTIAIPALTTTVFDSAPDADSGAASGINNAFARSGGLLAVAALGIAFGRSDLSSLSEQNLSNAYTVVMWFAALAAALSAVCAAATITSETENRPHEAPRKRTPATPVS